MRAWASDLKEGLTSIPPFGVEQKTELMHFKCVLSPPFSRHDSSLEFAILFPFSGMRAMAKRDFIGDITYLDEHCRVLGQVGHLVSVARCQHHADWRNCRASNCRH